MDEGFLIPIKAAPGARDDSIAGMLGDRLKVRVSAQAQNGRANDAVCVVLADALGVHPRDVCVERGHTNPEKLVRVRGSSFGSCEEALKNLV